MTWKAIGASVQGTSHLDSHLPCQDAHALTVQGRWLIAVVCDGAGSCAHAREGAEHGVSLCATLARILFDGEAVPDVPGADWPEKIAQAVGDLRESLSATIPDGAQGLRHYHATLVGCVVSESGGWFLHIGDGAAVALEGSSHTVLASSSPENGEYAEETYFYTEERWREHLRFQAIPAGADLIALMSDGTMSFALAGSAERIEEGFFVPVTRYLSDPAVDRAVGEEALANLLRSPGACSITRDDKTLVWARWTA